MLGDVILGFTMDNVVFLCNVLLDLFPATLQQSGVRRGYRDYTTSYQQHQTNHD